jgi:HTH-type transcriptional regulator/antitoxin HigA
MGVATVQGKAYAGLLAKTLPKVIETDRELKRFSAILEDLDRLERPSLEEKTLANLLAKLIEDYDNEHHQLPKLAPHEMIGFLMQQKGLKQADLLTVFGTRSVASDVIAGKREPSKAHIRKLAEFFQVSAELFL